MHPPDYSPVPSRESDTESDIEDPSIPLISSARAFLTSGSRFRRFFGGRTQRGIKGFRRYSPLARYATIAIQVVLLALLTSAIAGLIIALSSSSYADTPAHYQELRKRAKDSTGTGRVNLANERVFIAAILYDPKGALVSGAWGRDVLELINLIGPENSFLSLYESDSGHDAEVALRNFTAQVPCQHEIISEQTLPVDDIQTFVLPDGQDAVKRVAYLAAARNRALEPLKRADSKLGQFDRVLYLNDVFFDPVEAAQLLFTTNVQEDSRSEYGAACAMDFKSPLLYYDTWATRDMEGFGIGVPLYPWFTSAGDGQSRRDMMNMVDHVRVKSCWGGMVAFDARFFQPSATPALEPTTPTISFRSETELDWEYSECCLIHADIAASNVSTSPLTSFSSSSSTTNSPSPRPLSNSIYLNPYIRTAYTASTFSHLPLARRFERLLLPIQVLITNLAGLPFPNDRRTVAPGDSIWKRVWASGGRNYSRVLLEGQNWETREVEAGPGAFCGTRALIVRRVGERVGGEGEEEVQVGHGDVAQGNGSVSAGDEVVGSSWEQFQPWQLPVVGNATKEV